ncbi:MAG: translesion error-prone DNA polymerase V autoproteolytic subunit [Thiomicrospira sp.]|jgi:DNA polymerase V|nr:translesion error-prone DNA polymerase V autoproteolytic subunit [Thiomicrospira sp.]
MSEKKGRGGAREGAGRKKGSGLYKEPTKVVRLPESKIPLVKQWLSQLNETETEVDTVPIVPNLARAPLPESPGDGVSVHYPAANGEQLLPLFSHKVVAGFPSPADDNIEQGLDLNQYLVKRPETTFLLKVQGDSMKKVGIFNGDILIVDRSLEPADGKIVIAALDGELTVKRLSIKSTGTWLVPENDHYLPIPVRENSDMVIWGVVTATIRQF